MDKEQWIDAFERTKKKEEPIEAAKELLSGLRREAHSRLQRLNPSKAVTTIEDIGEELVNVERIWIEAAEKHPHCLKKDGFRQTTYLGDDDFEKALEAVGMLDTLPSPTDKADE